MSLTRSQTVLVDLAGTTEVVTIARLRDNRDLAKRLADTLHIHDLEAWLRSLNAAAFYDAEGNNIGPDSRGVCVFYNDDGMSARVENTYTLEIQGPYINVFADSGGGATFQWTHYRAGPILKLLSRPGAAPEAGEQWFRNSVRATLKGLSEWPPCSLTGRKARVVDDGQIVTIIGQYPYDVAWGSIRTYQVLYHSPKGWLTSIGGYIRRIPEDGLQCITDDDLQQAPRKGVAIAGAPNAGRMVF